MDTVVSRLTVYFEDPFWVGVYEREWGGKFEVCKVVFGAQPKDYEVYQHLLKNWHLLNFSSPTSLQQNRVRTVNPKRMQRLVSRQLECSGAGTKAQQALQLQREQNKQQKNALSRHQKELESARRFALRQQKRKEKHKGH